MPGAQVRPRGAYLLAALLPTYAPARAAQDRATRTGHRVTQYATTTAPPTVPTVSRSIVAQPLNPSRDAARAAA